MAREMTGCLALTLTDEDDDFVTLMLPDGREIRIMISEITRSRKARICIQAPKDVQIKRNKAKSSPKTSGDHRCGGDLIGDTVDFERGRIERKGGDATG